MFLSHINSNIIKELLNNLKDDGIQKVIAGAVIRFDDGKILLLERTPEEFKGGLVELPSGGVEKGENVIDGLAREIKEETGLEVESIDKYIGSFDYQSSSGKKVRQLNFVVSVKPGEVKINPSEHSQFYIADPKSESFQKLNISEKTKKVIRKSLQ